MPIRALSVLALAASAVVPTRSLQSLPPLCPSRWIGLHCPGCGMTRALNLLLHGHVRASLACNSRVILVALLLVIIALRGEPRLSNGHLLLAHG